MKHVIFIFILSIIKIKDNAILSAVDSDNVLYYSSDGNVWYKTRDNSAASDEKNAYLSQHIIGNRDVASNVVGVLFNSSVTPQPPVAEGDQDDQISEATNLISVITAAIDDEQDSSKEAEAPAAPPAPPAPSAEEVLLTEIRDLLKNK